MRTGGDHPDYDIIKIGQNTEKSYYYLLVEKTYYYSNSTGKLSANAGVKIFQNNNNNKNNNSFTFK